MIHTAGLLLIIGQFLPALSWCMLVPLLYGRLTGDDSLPFLYSIAVTGITGGLRVILTGRRENDLLQREGILLVFAAWIAACLFGCLPFFFFMLLAGINFTLHYRLWVERRVRRFFSDVELRFYLLVAAGATVIVSQPRYA